LHAHSRLACLIIISLSFSSLLILVEPLSAQSRSVYILWSGNSGGGFDFLVGPLQQAGFTVAIGPNPSSLDSFNVLVVFRGTYLRSISSSSLLDFASRGGGIFFTAGTPTSPDELGSINQISTNFGISYLSDDGMRDSDRGYHANDPSGNPLGLIVSDFLPHEVTAGVSRLGFWSNLAGGASGTNAAPVVRLNGGNVVARFSQSAYSTDGTYTSGSRPPAVVVNGYGRGRIVAAASDPQIAGISNGMMWGSGQYDDVRFFVNSAQWLAEPGLGPPQPQSQSQQQQQQQPQTSGGGMWGIGWAVAAVVIVILFVIFLVARRKGPSAGSKTTLMRTQKFCYNCGASIVQGNKYCTACGTPIQPAY
jgi:hypothetical protein